MGKHKAVDGIYYPMTKQAAIHGSIVLAVIIIISIAIFTPTSTSLFLLIKTASMILLAAILATAIFYASRSRSRRNSIEDNVLRESDFERINT